MPVRSGLPAWPVAAWLLAAMLLTACAPAPAPPVTPGPAAPDSASPPPAAPDSASPPPAAPAAPAEPAAGEPPADEPAPPTPVPRVALPPGQGPTVVPAAGGMRFSVEPLNMEWRGGRLLAVGRGPGYQALFALDPGGDVETLLALAPEPEVWKAEPLASGALLAAVYRPAELWFYPAEGDPQFLLMGHNFSVAPDGSRALLYGIDGQTWLLDAHSGSVSPAPRIPSYEFPYSGVGVTWLPDSRHVVVWRGGNAGLHTALVDVVAGRDVIDVGRPGFSAYGTPSPDGRYLAVVWVSDGEQVWQEEAAFAEPIGRELTLHDVESGTPVAFAAADPEDRIIGPPVWVEDAAWFAVGQYEVAGGPVGMVRPRSVRLWQLAVDGAAGPAPAEGTPGDMAPRALSPSGRYIAFFAANAWGKEIVIYDRTVNRAVTTVPGAHGFWLAGDRLAAVGATAWQLYDATGAVLGSFPGYWDGLHPAPDGRHVAARGQGWVHIIPVP